MLTVGKNLLWSVKCEETTYKLLYLGAFLKNCIYISIYPPLWYVLNTSLVVSFSPVSKVGEFMFDSSYLQGKHVQVCDGQPLLSP